MNELSLTLEHPVSEQYSCYLDRFYSGLGKILYRKKPRLFSQGWGDTDVIETLNGWQDFQQQPPAINIHWQKRHFYPDLYCRDGYFESAVAMPAFPDECRQAHFRMVLPHKDFKGPVYIHLAASGDEGFENRFKHVATPLARNGIGSILLENPYFGLRRPKEQYKVRLRYASDLLLLGASAVQDVRGLINWSKEQFGDLIGVTGISMGGHLSSLAAVLSPHKLAIVPFLAPHSGIAVFVDGLTADHIDWEKLGEDTGGVEQARDRMRKILSFTGIDALPVPTNKVIYGTCATNDGFVAWNSSQVWLSHWSHGNFTQISGGHVQNIMLQRKLYLQKLTSAMRDLAIFTC